MNGLNCFGIEVRNARTKRLTMVDSQMVVASGITTSNPAIRSFLRSCRSLADNGRSGLGVDWTKKPLCPGFGTSDQPNQQSEHCCQGKQGERQRQNRSRCRSTDEPLARFTTFLILKTFQLGLHLIDLLINHRQSRPPLVVLSGISSQLSRLGQLFPERRNLLLILSELSGLLDRQTALFEVLMLVRLTCILRQG